MRRKTSVSRVVFTKRARTLSDIINNTLSSRAEQTSALEQERVIKKKKMHGEMGGTGRWGDSSDKSADGTNSRVALTHISSAQAEAQQETFRLESTLI